jgi:hypothetical protein
MSAESMREWCENGGAGAAGGVGGLAEAWCLQYNQHLGRTLLAPVEEPRSIMDEMVKEALLRRLPDYMRAGGGGGAPGAEMDEMLKEAIARRLPDHVRSREPTTGIVVIVFVTN